jgi:hypothetical protein
MRPCVYVCVGGACEAWCAERVRECVYTRAKTLRAKGDASAGVATTAPMHASCCEQLGEGGGRVPSPSFFRLA